MEQSVAFSPRCLASVSTTTSPMITESRPFTFEGVNLIGTLTLPDATTVPVPGVVTAPGFAGVKEMLHPEYAAALANCGVASLAFDYPGFGESDGTPRQHIDPPQQARSLRAALDALATDPRIDAQRLGAWGVSLSGGHTLVLAATDPRIKCAAAIVPFIAIRGVPDLRLVRETAVDLIARTLRRPQRMIRVTGRPGELAAMNSDGAFEWAAEMTADAPRYRNEVTSASLINMARWSTVKAARKVQVPLRVILAERDTITPAARVRRALRDASNVDIQSFPDTHFKLFAETREAVMGLTVDWLAQHLPAQRPE
jgi:dienelactone hydrolase